MTSNNKSDDGMFKPIFELITQLIKGNGVFASGQVTKRLVLDNRPQHVLIVDDTQRGCENRTHPAEHYIIANAMPCKFHLVNVNRSM